MLRSGYTDVTKWHIFGLAILILLGVFATAVVWEFVLEPAFERLFGGPGRAESVQDHWKFVIASTVFAAVALIVPSLISVRLAAERRRFEAKIQADKERAEVADRAKTEFLAITSHELRTPLNAIIGFSEMIRSHTFGPVGNPKYVEYAKDIHESGLHLLALINDILDLSKVEAGKLEFNAEAIDLELLVADCAGLVGQRIDAGGLRLAHDFPSGLPLIWVDPRHIKQILLNLLSNAIKFTPPGGQITIAASADTATGLTITVADTGIGIAPGDIAKALAPFGQIENSMSRNFDGTGLGLSLSRALVEAHGGSLLLAGEVDRGTVVTLTFPADRLVERPVVECDVVERRRSLA